MRPQSFLRNNQKILLLNSRKFVQNNLKPPDLEGLKLFKEPQEGSKVKMLLCERSKFFEYSSISFLEDYYFETRTLPKKSEFLK